MSRIDDLLRQHCPNGIEFRPIGEIGELVRGNGMPRSDFVDSGVGCIHYGQVYMNYGTWATETLSFVSEQTAAKLAKVNPGDLVITNTSENLDDVCKAVAWMGDSQIVTGGHATVLKHAQDPRFLSYYTQTPEFHAQKRRFANGTKVIDVSAKNLAKIRVPVPPIEVQAEIVRVLDVFQSLEVELEVELEAELESRRRQYAHYRDSLLTFDDSRERVRWVTLAEIAKFTYGYTATAQEDGDLRFVRITDISDDGRIRASGAKYVDATPEAERYRLRDGDVLVARTGASYGKTALVTGDTQAAFASFLIRIGVDRKLMRPSFLWHFAQSGSYWSQADALVSVGGQPQFNANVLGRIRLPLPDLLVQDGVVAVLDKFDALVADLSVGLPAELVARRQQYEYYRDRLLTFEEAA